MQKFLVSEAGLTGNENPAYHLSTKPAQVFFFLNQVFSVCVKSFITPCNLYFAPMKT